MNNWNNWTCIIKSSPKIKTRQFSRRFFILPDEKELFFFFFTTKSFSVDEVVLSIHDGGSVRLIKQADKSAVIEGDKYARSLH